MNATAPQAAGPPMGLIIGGVVLIVVVIVIIVILNMGSSPAPAPARSPAPALSPAPAPAPVPVYTTGPQNITAFVAGLNATWGSRVSTCPNIVQQVATWLDSQGIIAVPRGASCPSSAPTLGPSIGANNTITLCLPQNAPPNIQLPDSIQTPLSQCVQK